MIIKQIYNNNIVLAKNKEGNEVILIGKGIAFGMDKGDMVFRNKIEKQFELKGEARSKFQQLIKNMSMDYILASEEIISFIKKKYQKKLSDTIYVTLTDHIMSTVERIQMGTEFDNALLGNVKQLYNEEYKIGVEVVEMLSQRFDLKIDANEANFIALHIINAQLDTNMMQIYTITEIIGELLQIVNHCFQIGIEENYAYDRFVTHCRFFVQRVLNNYKNSMSDHEMNTDILELMQSKYIEQAQCIKEICAFIEKKYSYKVNQDEQLYLMLHMIKLTA